MQSLRSIEPWASQDDPDSNALNKHPLEAFLLAADPRQPLVLPDDTEIIFTVGQVRRHPERILDIITDKDATFSRNDILRALADYIDDPIKLRRASDQVLQSKELVELHNTPTPLYSTVKMERLKASLADQTQSMAAKKSFGVKSHYIRAAIQQQNATLQKSVGANLSDEQHQAIEHILDNRQLKAVIGLAGTGKSTLLAAANEAWAKQGYQVLGAALSGKAADSLQEASGIASRTLASLEMSWKNGFSLLQPGDVLVIDEVGMVGTRQMARFVEETQRRGAKLVLVGDPEQLQPINAGTPFRNITEQIGCADLTEIRRQKADWQRQASRDLAQDRTEKALKAYADHGAIEFSGNRSQAITTLVQDYMVDLELHGTDASRLALAHRRIDVHAINQAIRMARKLGGELTDEKLFKTNHGPRAFAVGDRILFTKNDRELGVRNGLLGTVEAIDENQIAIKFDRNEQDEPRRLTIFPKRYSAIDHGYATTIHKSQGATVDRTFILSSRKMDRHLTYVAMSRHRDAAKLYIDNSNVQSRDRKGPPARSQQKLLRRRR